jgi:hypothetical protein
MRFLRYPYPPELSLKVPGMVDGSRKRTIFTSAGAGAGENLA